MYFTTNATQAHLQDLNKSRDLQKVLQMSESKRSKTDVGNVESQFTREENIRGIEARIDTVMVRTSSIHKQIISIISPRIIS